jgi:hypothetical protein
MVEEGKYIYCIIGTNEGRNFGAIGIGGRGDIVSTIGYEDLSAVISNSPLDKYVVNKENLIAHEKVVEEVMKNYTVLPMRFCTVASSAEEVRNLLRKRYLELKSLLKDMDNKIELGVKAFWKEMKVIFQEMVDEDHKIKSLKEKIAKKSLQESYAEGINLGKIVKTALEVKRDKEGQEIINVLKRISYNFHLHETQGDEMLINAVFLVDRAREREFDNQVQKLVSKYSPRVKFKYIGPTPPYNFVNLNLK